MMRWMIFLLAIASLTAPVRAAEPFVFNDGDRIAFIGSTIVEREQTFGWVETFLYTRYPDKNITLRNLGWSGDNVWGESRAGFGKVSDGYALLIKQVTEVKPTVIMLCYGENESFDGSAGLAKFVEQYNTLLNDLGKTGARLVLIAPPLHERLRPELPDPSSHNNDLKLYRDAIRKIATERKAAFVDLIELISVNGNHYTDSSGALPSNGGFWAMGSAIQIGLGGPPASSAETEWPGRKPVSPLRAAIIEKNRLYFCRYRPQNETYIFGFRKHEQGQNAVEIPQFDPLIEAQEKQIAELRKSVK